MSVERRDLLIGRRAVERGWIAEPVLAAAIACQERDITEGLTARPIGALLVEAAALTPDRVAELIDEQSHALVLEEDALFGAILVRNGLAAADAVDRALADQRAGAASGRLGEVLLARGAIDAKGLRAALAAQGRLAGRQATRAGVGGGDTRQGAFVTQVPEVVGETAAPELARFGLTPADLDEARRLRDAGAAAFDRTLTEADSDRFDALRGKPLAEILVALGKLAAAHAADLEAALATPAPRGPRRFGRYELRAELGHGGMGKVYRAWDPDLKREVALKVLLLGDRADADGVDRFQREARAAAGLSHPGIVPVYDVGAVAGKPYYTMELVAADELTDLARAGGLTARDAVEIVRQVAEALRFSHARGILHRDIKPRNVFVARDGATLTARVIDFGLAKFAEDEVRMDAGSKAGASLRTLTQTGQMLGTPLYMSPEQFAKAAEVDGRADVYSVGATLYELFTGAPPFADAAGADPQGAGRRSRAAAQARAGPGRRRGDYLPDMPVKDAGGPVRGGRGAGRRLPAVPRGRGDRRAAGGSAGAAVEAGEAEPGRGDAGGGAGRAAGGARGLGRRGGGGGEGGEEGSAVGGRAVRGGETERRARR